MDLGRTASLENCSPSQQTPCNEATGMSEDLRIFTGGDFACRSLVPKSLFELPPKSARTKKNRILSLWGAVVGLSVFRGQLGGVLSTLSGLERPVQESDWLRIPYIFGSSSVCRGGMQFKACDRVALTAGSRTVAWPPRRPIQVCGWRATPWRVSPPRALIWVYWVPRYDFLGLGRGWPTSVMVRRYEDYMTLQACLETPSKAPADRSGKPRSQALLLVMTSLRRRQTSHGASGEVLRELTVPTA
jgi:hypothetical protein